MMKNFVKIALALGALGLAGEAQAGTATGTIAVSATVVSSCAVTSAGAMAFGNVTGNAVAYNATSTINITCTNGTPYTYYANTGANYGSGQMRMQGVTTAGQFLNYGIYTSAAATTAFPTTSALATTAGTTGTGNGSAQAYTVYGQIPINTTLPSPQAYADTVTLTVSY